MVLLRKDLPALRQTPGERCLLPRALLTLTLGLGFVWVKPECHFKIDIAAGPPALHCREIVTSKGRKRQRGIAIWLDELTVVSYFE